MIVQLHRANETLLLLQYSPPPLALYPFLKSLKSVAATYYSLQYLLSTNNILCTSSITARAKKEGMRSKGLKELYSTFCFHFPPPRLIQ